MKTKSFKLIGLTLLSMATLLIGCSEDEWLNEVNPNTITTDIFWETPTQFNSALTTVYGATQFQAISGGGLQFEMMLGDEAGTESWYGPFAFRNLTYNDGASQIEDKWSQLYIGIFRANQVINNIANADGSLFSEGEKEVIEAQARFLRAFFYFEVAHTFGGGIIRTEAIEGVDNLPGKFSSIEEITNSIIIPDLEFAKAHLPRTWDAANKARVTWGTATSLLGKVYLYGKEWSTAAGLFKSVIDSDIYELTDNVNDNFRHDTEFNSESIFEVAYSADLNPGAGGDAVDDNSFESGAEASSLARATGQLNYGAYNTVLPTYYMHELFLSDEIDPSNPVNNGFIQSQRMYGSIVPSNADGLYYGDEPGAKGWAYGQSSYVKKHSNWYHLTNEDGLSRSGINFRHIRYADVLLMYAEALLNSGGSVDQAIDYIDMVRARAGVITLKQYLADNGNTFPQLHISKQVHGTQPYVAPTAENVLTHLQRVERPLELCYEGHRYKDLVRWGIVQEVYDELRADEEWRINNFETIEEQAPLFIVQHTRPDFLFSSQNYNPAEFDYFPIPAAELQTNDGL
ncbi:RagB/SusD family nutrient uptake outer membrane protein [Zobellia galactanivorans]|uniref:SusD/RagB family lipoprotein n=1 Tax=Zobellia galactanivorans (strain DSM 12802 / CCUG 47099 / CIP 106680 / NCIMB 13871 / Dsij) TaxID=63186 RepID=G0L5S4_ZOBGA|nr:RagB/SusD family nutrient uptake outer membrane protein [Zobellia galactanivorans]MBU3026236.1 RagB/SusD family nutrient uptake outer membrane protein [Zobellia galactanivorans]CAZ96452.1 SusD/RagB family lipoprotein [Zobellia galactanivorans]